MCKNAGYPFLAQCEDTNQMIPAFQGIQHSQIGVRKLFFFRLPQTFEFRYIINLLGIQSLIISIQPGYNQAVGTDIEFFLDNRSGCIYLNVKSRCRCSAAAIRPSLYL
jgi:hypothetical protein